MRNEMLRPYFLVILIVGALSLTALIFAPFFKSLVLAAVFAVVLQGLNRRISRFLKGWPSISALLTIIIGVLLILLPLALIGVLVANEAANVYFSLDQASERSALASSILQINERFGGVIPGLDDLIRGLSANVDTYAKEAVQWIARNFASIFSGITSLFLSLFIFFIALYYFLRDGKSVRRALIELSPLTDKEDEGIFDKLELAVNSVIRGNLVIALLQGVLAAIGFTILGVPNGILLGALAALAALVPGLGTALIFIPTAGFLFLTGAIVQGVALLVWGALAVGLVDNFLGPMLIGRGIQLHPLLILLSVLGGLFFFGPVGVFLGPISLSFLFAVLSIYGRGAQSLEIQ